MFAVTLRNVRAARNYSLSAPSPVSPLYANCRGFVPLARLAKIKPEYIAGNLMIELRQKTQNFFKI
jgi:hypothetical protein